MPPRSSSSSGGRMRRSAIRKRLLASVTQLLFFFLLVGRPSPPAVVGADGWSSHPTRPNTGGVPHGYYEALRLDPSTASMGRFGNVEWITTNISNASSPDGDEAGAAGGGEDEDGGEGEGVGTSATGVSSVEATATEEVALCHLANFLCFSKPHFDHGCDPWHMGVLLYPEISGLLLAMKHFNNGDGRVVKELDGIDRRCPIRFTAEFQDTGCSPVRAVQTLTRLLADRSDESVASQQARRRRRAQEVSGEFGNGNGTTTPHRNRPPPPPLPCSIVGASYSSVTKPAAVVSNTYDLVQMSFTATSPDLSSQFRYPLFSRVVPPDDAAAQAAVKFFGGYCGASNVAMLFLNDAFGSGYQTAFQRAALEGGVTVKAFPVEYNPTQAQVENAVAGVKSSGFRYVFVVILARESYEMIMTEAARQSLVGPGYVYLLGNHGDWLNDVEYEAGSPLAMATEGLAVLPEFGGQPDAPGYRRFREAWGDLDGDDVSYFNSMLPDVGGRPGSDCFAANATHFQDGAPTGIIAPFAYDTVVALGLGACRAIEEKKAGGGDEGGNDDGRVLDGAAHSDAIVSGEAFEGASGLVKMDRETESRDPRSFAYVVSNAILTRHGRRTADASSAGMASVSLREAIVLQPDEDGRDWLLVQRAPFVFAGGSTIPPPDLPPVPVDMNYIGNVRIMGYFCFAIVAVCSLGFSFFTWKNRNVHVIRASQPMFLAMICAGTLTLGSAIIPLSIDDEHFSQQGCGIACMASPWLTSVGFVTAFSALLSKTRRINKLMRCSRGFRRVKVTEKDVMKPFALLMAANVLVLIVWTVLSPLTFVRTADGWTDQWGRVVSSHGSCRAVAERRGGSIPYFILLGAINLCAVVLANIEAYRARNVHTEYSESRYIAMVNVSLLQAWLSGLPLFFLVQGNPTALFAVCVLIIFLSSMAILLLIFVPKYVYYRKSKKDAEAKKEQKNKSPADKFSVRMSDGAEGIRFKFSTDSFYGKRFADFARSSLGWRDSSGSNTSRLNCSNTTGINTVGSSATSPGGQPNSFVRKAQLVRELDSGEEGHTDSLSRESPFHSGDSPGNSDPGIEGLQISVIENPIEFGNSDCDRPSESKGLQVCVSGSPVRKDGKLSTSEE